MSFQLAKAYVEFSQKGMGGVTGAIGGLAGKLKSLVSPMGLVTAGLGALGAGAGIGGMLKLASETEALETQFRVLLGSGDAAKRMLADINEFAASTPFEQMELGTAAKQLLATGSAAGDIVGEMRQLGDIAALSGQRLGDLVNIYGKIRGQGKLTAETINQFAERGIPLVRQLAEQFGVSEAEIRKMASSGKISFKDVQKAIGGLTAEGGQFAGGMAELAKTTGGMWSTVTGNLKTLLANFGSGIIEAFRLKDILGTLGTWLGTVAENFQSNFGPAIAWMRDAVGSVVDWIVGKFSEMTAWVKSMWAEWGDVVRAWAGAVRAQLVMFYEIGVAIFTGVWEFYSSVFAAMGNLLDSWFGSSTAGFKEAAIDWYQSAEFFFANWKLYLQIGWQEFLRFIMNIPAYFKAAVQNMGNLIMWFGENWRDILFTSADYVLTIMVNLGQNIRNIWQGVLDFFAGKGFHVDWTPLTEGFHNSIKKMPGFVEAEIHKTTPELDKLYKELDKRRAEFQAKKQAGGTTEAETEAAAGPELPGGEAGSPGAPGAPGAGGKQKFQFFGLAAFADQMQQAASQAAEKRQEMAIQQKQADATQQLADAAGNGGLKVTVVNARELQPQW